MPPEPVRIGCSGWNYADWRALVYPQGLPPSRWLEHYATLFDTVEVNSTFYRLPRREAVARWVEQTPEGFVFAIKASRYLTHVKRLRDVRPGAARFYERLEPLLHSPKMGPLLWQLPGNFRRDDDRLRSALEQLPPGRHCFEFRHESWFVPEVYELLRSHEAALVIGDHPERPFQAHELTTDWAFVRFHYGRRGRNGNYSERELEEWAQRIDGWRQRAEVYAYFNNDWRGYAVKNGLWLKNRFAKANVTSDTSRRQKVYQGGNTMRERLPLVLSVTAVFIAVLGSTSLGQAAGNAVGQTVQKAKSSAGFGPSASRALRGPRGPRGRRGPRGFRGLPGDDGADGAPGSAVAFGYVTAAGALEGARSKGIASATRVSEGRYCVVLATGVTGLNAVATIGQGGLAIAADVAFGLANCPSGIEVRTYSGDGTFTNNDFYININ